MTIKIHNNHYLLRCKVIGELFYDDCGYLRDMRDKNLKPRHFST